MTWYRSRYLKVGISGFFSGTLIVLMLADALMGYRVVGKNPDMAYRAEAPAGKR
jgi:hypothetical protein